MRRAQGVGGKFGEVYHRQAPIALQCVEYFCVETIKLHVSPTDPL